MSELFIELYSEEMPLNFFNSIKTDFEEVIKEMFLSENLVESISDDFCQIYTTPCRIVFCTNVLADSVMVKHREIVGPRVDAEAEEINGFLKAFNARSIDKLEKRDGNYVLVQDNFEIKTKKFLEENMVDALTLISSSFSQNMKWNGNSDIKWISPLRNILCLFNGEVIDFEFCGLKSNNYTYGHKILVGLDKKIEISGFDDYRAKMAENFVVFDQYEREKVIVDKILKIENSINYSTYKVNECNFEKNLIREVVNSTEYPDVFFGEFKQEFLKLPNVIITNIVYKKYRCFCLFDNSTKFLSNKFILFANTKTTDNGENIIAGISNVINLKLSFMNSEIIRFLSESIDTKINRLKSVPYHKGFGTLYNKVERLIELSKFICLWIPHSDLISTEEAAKLCKIDMTSSLVCEDPELKGHLSAYYARANNYPEVVCRGIEEYYEPRNLCDRIPESDIGKILSISGRVDNITTLFITNEEATSSKDPFGIRKNVTSVIKIIVDGNINIPINILIHKSISLFKTAVYKKNNDSKISVKQQIVDIESSMIELFKKRFISFLIELGFENDIINAVANINIKNSFKQPLSLTCLYKKIIQVTEYIKKENEKFASIRNTYKRLNNILEGFKVTDIGSIIEKIFHKRYLRSEQEKLIATKIKEIKKSIKKESRAQNYTECLNLLLEFNDLVNGYFKEKLIKTDNARETNSRLFLLYKIKKIFDNFLNFSELKNF